MSKKNTGLDASYDDVDFFGLDRAGSEVNPMWGAVAGTGAGTLAAVGVTQFTDMDKYSELIGLGVGVVLGGVMAAFRSTRAAGFTAMAAAVLNNGVRASAQLLSAKQQVKDATGAQVTAASAGVKGMGAIYSQGVPALAGLPGQALNGVRAQSVPALGMPPGVAPFSASSWGTTGTGR